jgi:hypothetical protein
LNYYGGKCFIIDPNCIDFNQTSNQCSQCYDGYALNANTKLCQKAQSCLTYSGSICVKCFTGFQLNTLSLQCSALPYNCLFVNSLNSCTSCSTPTLLLSQQTLSTDVFAFNLSIVVNTTVCVYSTPNCKYYNTFGYCEICISGYVQTNHQCFIAVQNCAVPLSTDQSKCTTCSTGYQLDANLLLCYPKQ